MEEKLFYWDWLNSFFALELISAIKSSLLCSKLIDWAIICRRLLPLDWFFPLISEEIEFDTARPVGMAGLRLPGSAKGFVRSSEILGGFEDAGLRSPIDNGGRARLRKFVTLSDSESLSAGMLISGLISPPGNSSPYEGPSFACKSALKSDPEVESINGVKLVDKSALMDAD